MERPSKLTNPIRLPPNQRGAVVRVRPLYDGATVHSRGPASVGLERYQPTGSGNPLLNPCTPNSGTAEAAMIKRGCFVEFVFLDAKAVAKVGDKALRPGPALRFCVAPGKPGRVVNVATPEDAEARTAEICGCIEASRTTAGRGCPSELLPNAPLAGAERSRTVSHQSVDFKEAFEQKHRIPVVPVGEHGSVHTFVIGDVDKSVADLERIELAMLEEDASTGWLVWSKVEVADVPFWTVGIAAEGLPEVVARLGRRNFGLTARKTAGPTAESIAPLRLVPQPSSATTCDLVHTPARMRELLKAEVDAQIENAKRRGKVPHRQPLSEDDLSFRQLPPEVEDFGRFMLYQSSRDLSPRDVVKAYTLTRSSIMRGAIFGQTLRQYFPEAPWSDDESVRPEDAFSYILQKTKAGQAYLNAAEKGQFDERAAVKICEMHAGYGHSGLKDGVPDPRQAASGLYWSLLNGAELAQKSREILGALRSPSKADWQALITQVPGIGAGKAGFVASLLGRGDIPTGDARELDLWLQERGKAPSRKQMFRFIEQLTQRLQELQVGMPADLQPFYQHLVHHYLWDLAGGTHTTHADIMACLRFAGRFAGPPAALAILSGADSGGWSNPKPIDTVDNWEDA
jgi:hypothetical protein